MRIPSFSPLAPAALLLLIAAAQPAGAVPPECSCKNLESLQQDYQNAAYLADFMQGMGEHLKAIEDRLEKIKATDPDHPDADLNVHSTTGNAKQLYMDKNLKIPFWIEDYKGPDEVAMDYGTCNQKPQELADMEAGSPCKAMADAALDHEAAHREKCNEMGPKAYWDRKLSEIAFEESARYDQQAADLKDELRRVLDAADVVYTGDWTFDLQVGSMAQYGYSYSGESEDIGGATDGDTWTMTGKGTSTIAWTKAVIAGMQCTTSGAVNSNYTLTMRTDGLTFGLEIGDMASSGALGIKCPGGGGGGPVGDAGGEGLIAEGLEVREGTIPLPGDMGSEIRAIMAGMGRVTGDGKRELSITCQQ